MKNLKNITIIDSTGLGVLIPPALIFVACGIGLLVVVGLYLLRSFGLYAMAKKENHKNPNLAFIPFVWIYTASLLAGKVSFFGKKFKNFAVIALVVFCLTEAIALFINAVVYIPVVGYFLQGGEITIAAMRDGLPSGLVEYPLLSGVFLRNYFLYPYATSIWLIKFATVLSYLYDLLSILEIIVLVMIYIGIFRKYWPEHSFLGCAFSIFGFFPIVIFALRKRQPINYEEYVRARFYGVHANTNQGQPSPKEDIDPFGYDMPKEAKKDEDPFPEFKDDDRRE